MRIVIHNSLMFLIDAKKKANLAYVFVYISCLLHFLYFYFQNCLHLLLILLFFGHFYFLTEHLCVCVCVYSHKGFKVCVYFHLLSSIFILILCFFYIFYNLFFLIIYLSFLIVNCFNKI